MTEQLIQKWKCKRHFPKSYKCDLSYAIQSQYRVPARKLARDKEIVRLQSKESYVNPANDENNAHLPYFASKFCTQDNFSNVFAVADEIGNLSLHDVYSPKVELGRTVVLNNAIFDLLWVPGETKVLALCGDHTARLYDVGEGQITPITTFVGHTKSVKTGDFLPCDSAIFATGSRDGQVLIFDSRASQNPGRRFWNRTWDRCIAFAAGDKRSKKSSYNVSSSSSVTALAIQDQNSLICCGSMDEYIRTWDLRMTYCEGKAYNPRNLKKTPRKGYNDLKISADKTRMYVSSLGGPIFCFNLNSSVDLPMATFHGHDAGSFYVKTSLSADGEYLASGSTDEYACVWKTSQAELEVDGRFPLLRLPGHSGEVTGVDFSSSPNIAMISCSEVGDLRAWLPTAIPLDSDEVHNAHTFFAQLNIGTSIKVPIAEPSAQKMLPSTSSSRDGTPSPHRSDSKHLCAKRKFQESSPKREVKRPTLSPAKGNEYKSPTLNLPNYVLEGTGPWHSCSRMRQKENLNWLTEIRRKSADKRTRSAEQCKRRRSLNQKRPASRRTLLEYYKKSSQPTEKSSSPASSVKSVDQCVESVVH